MWEGGGEREVLTVTTDKGDITAKPLVTTERRAYQKGYYFFSDKGGAQPINAEHNY